MKTPKQLERYFKGASNHHRIAILSLINKEPDLTLGDITNRLDGNFKTMSEHTRRLVQAGLVNKRYKGQKVLHSLSPYGKKFIKFFKTF